MSRKELILKALSAQQLCDDCLSEETNIMPRQSVNQCCRKDLAGIVIRTKEKACSVCKNANRKDKIVNEIA